MLHSLKIKSFNRATQSGVAEEYCTDTGKIFNFDMNGLRIVGELGPKLFIPPVKGDGEMFDPPEIGDLIVTITFQTFNQSENTVWDWMYENEAQRGFEFWPRYRATKKTIPIMVYEGIWLPSFSKSSFENNYSWEIKQYRGIWTEYDPNQQ